MILVRNDEPSTPAGGGEEVQPELGRSCRDLTVLDALFSHVRQQVRSHRICSGPQTVGLECVPDDQQLLRCQPGGLEEICEAQATRDVIPTLSSVLPANGLKT